jgi:hypothetical protein
MGERFLDDSARRYSSWLVRSIWRPFMAHRSRGGSQVCNTGLSPQACAGRKSVQLVRSRLRNRINPQEVFPDFGVPFVLAPNLRSSLAPEVFGSLPAFVEPVSHQVQKPINRHSGGLSFGRVKIPESVGPGSASGAFSFVRLVLEAFPHTYRISTGIGASLVSIPHFLEITAEICLSPFCNS